MIRLSLFIIPLAFLLIACDARQTTEPYSQELNSIPNTNNQASQPTTNPQPTQSMNNNSQVQLRSAEELLNLESGQELFATLHTSMGDIRVKLFPEQAPQTVGNFVGLAEGTQPWIDPKTNQVVEDKPLYQDIQFHRIIDGFMIQGGDPLGQGIGGPGYRFGDEIDPSLTFSKPGLLAMANAGPGTNGSQFFITVAETSWLNGKHTIFGEVVEGMDVVNQMAVVETGVADRPVEPVVLQSVEIERV